MEEEQEEWESELEKSLIKLQGSCDCDAGALVIDGTAARQQYGLILIAGGYTVTHDSARSYIFDYTNNSVREGPSANIERWRHASVTLPNGDVVLFGGCDANNNQTTSSSCELFNAKRNSFSKIADMLEKREGPAAVLLRSGLVLIIGGYGNDYSDSCEFYHPENNTFTPSKAKMTTKRHGHTASLLPDGKVLVCGGHDKIYYIQTTEIYDPETDSFSAGPLMTVKRVDHQATTLSDGRILLTGGENAFSSDSTEIYDAATNSFASGPTMIEGRKSHFSVLLPDGSVLLSGGYSSFFIPRTELYDPSTNRFSLYENDLDMARDCSVSLF
jgi:hypothetical protein